jgi:hypothetical protein
MELDSRNTRIYLIRGRLEFDNSRYSCIHDRAGTPHRGPRSVRMYLGSLRYGLDRSWSVQGGPARPLF